MMGNYHVRFGGQGENQQLLGVDPLTPTTSSSGNCYIFGDSTDDVFYYKVSQVQDLMLVMGPQGKGPYLAFRWR
jgi:hypothetical protein